MCLINNAAVFPGDGQEPFESIDPGWFSQAFETNVVGVARVTKAFLPHLRRSAQARIANISSGAGSISEKEDFHLLSLLSLKSGAEHAHPHARRRVPK